MWEGLVRSPRGRMSARNLILLLATCFVVVFAHFFVLSTPVNAADAFWKDGAIVYSNHTYTKKTAVAGDGLNLPADTEYYLYTEPVANSDTKKAFVIYFGSGTSPPQATQAQHQSYYLVNNVFSSDGSSAQAIGIQQDVSSTAPKDPVLDGTTSCAVEGMGWIVCPVTNMLATGMDKIYSVVGDYLKVTPLATNTNNAMYRAWGYAQAISNVLFIIAFLVIIYSQVSGVGISAYGIRKILPRIIAAAVLINLSYWMCAIAVDISNILGWSINDLFMSIRNSLVGEEGNTWEYISWGNMAAAILSGGTIIGGGLIGLSVAIPAFVLALQGGGLIGVLMIFVPMLLSVLFVVLMTFLILAARQALIILLIIIAPLAFAAYLLPNTEKWFERWRTTLFTLLLLYPAFAAVFGGAQLASAVIVQGAKGANSFNMLLLAMAVQVAPLAIMPLLLKLGGGVLNRFAGIVNNPTKGVFDKGKQWSRDRRDENAARGASQISAMNNAGNLSRRRFNPRRMAYARLHRNTAREQEKSANEALTKGYFSQTNDARRIAMINKRAGLEQEIGDNESNAAWQESTYRDPTLNHRVHRAHRAHKEADLYKEAVDAQSDEHWQQALQNDIRLRTVRSEKHLAAGRTKIMDEALTNQDERQFQDMLEDGITPQYAALRALKVQSIRDSKHAQFKESVVAAAGTRAYAADWEDGAAGSRDLRLKNVNRVVDEKAAAAIQTTVDKRAEAHWDHISRTDAATQTIRLKETQATDAATRSAAEWNSLVEDIKSQGDSARYVAAGNVSIARSIKHQQQAIEIEGMRASSFKVSQQQNLAGKLKEDELLRMHAGGDTEQGATRVLAKATKDVIDAAVDEVKVNRTLTSSMTRKQLHRVLYDGIDPDGNRVTTEMRQAAMYELLQEKGNNMDAQEIRDAVATMGYAVDENTGEFYEPQRDAEGNVRKDNNGMAIPDTSRPLSSDEAGKRRDWQQFFEDASSGSKLNLGTMSGTNKSEAKSGTMTDTTRKAFIRDVMSGKFKPESIMKYDVDELMIFLEDMRKPDGEYEKLSPEKKEIYKNSLIAAVTGAQTHPSYKGQIEERSRGVMNEMVAKVDPSYLKGRDASGNALFAVGKDNEIVKPTNRPDEKVFRAPINVDERQRYTDRRIT